MIELRLLAKSSSDKSSSFSIFLYYGTIPELSLIWISYPDCVESFIVWSMSNSDIWYVFIVSVPVLVLFCLSRVLFEAGVVLSLISRGLPLAIVSCRLMVGGSGLVSVSSSDWDFLGVLFVLVCFLANLPSGHLGPVPLFVGSCSNVIICFLISLR